METNIDHWNYRIVESVGSTGDKYYSVHEIYYDKSNEIVSWYVEPMFPTGETVSELTKDVELMLEAMTKPPIKKEYLINKFNGNE